MLLVREVFHCKPGKVRPLAEKFLAMSKLNEKMGVGKMRILTDMAGPSYWTLVAEMEVESLKAFEEMLQGVMPGANTEDMKEFERIMDGYHNLVDHGKREIFKIEG